MPDKAPARIGKSRMASFGLKRIGLLVTAAAMVFALSGCGVITGRKVQATPPPPFQSPISAPVGRPGMTLPQIYETLGERRVDTRSLLGDAKVTVGHAKSKARQQFDVDFYSAPPSFLRARASIETGTLFDFLLEDNAVRLMTVPDQKFYMGTLENLRKNRTLMAGVQPDDLISSFFVEQNLYRVLGEAKNPGFREDQNHYFITIGYHTGVSEVYRLRKSDLLVDFMERIFEKKQIGSVRFDSYAYFNEKYLIPTRFEAALRKGAVATIESTNLQPNAPRNEALTTLEPSPDFQRVPL